MVQYFHETSVIDTRNLGELSTPSGNGPVLPQRKGGFNLVQLPFRVACIYYTIAYSTTNLLPSEFIIPYGKGPVFYT